MKKDKIKLIAEFSFAHQVNADNVALALCKGGYLVKMSGVTSQANTIVHVYEKESEA